jgi:hypothetical protein
VQSPSSLIFLVLLAVWAAYFAQYWLRRRDHLATARAVDQFTEAMRVLERRPPLPRTDLSEAVRPSYAVHPARAARPQVLVKRAVAVEPPPTGVTARVPSGSTHAPREATKGSPGASANRSAPEVAPARRVGPRGPSRVRPSRRTRGFVLLAALAELAAMVPLVALSLVPVWALAPAVLAVVWAFFWVRSAVRAEQAMARARRRRPTRVPSSDASRDDVRAPGDADDPAQVRRARPDVLALPPDETDRGVGAGEHAVAPAEAADLAAASAVEGPDDEAGEGRPARSDVAATAEVMVPIVDEDDIPLTWDPVPVPRPTYTMKAKAERPEVAPAAVTPDPAPVRQETVGDGTAYERRRAAGA